MTDNDTAGGAIPVEQWPDPVCRYRNEDGSPVVDGVNAAFRTAFERVPTDQRVSDALGDLGLTVVSDRVDFDSLGTSTGDIVVERDGSDEHTRYLVRPIAGEGNDGGLLVFTALSRDGQGNTAEWVDLDHVASVVSHDLRNPLDVAKAHLRAARETGDETHFDTVSRAHGRMERIIDDVLTLARGPDVVDPDDEVDLGTAAEAAWKTVETDGSDLVVERPLPTVVADRDRLRRLFENLFRNAVEHGHRGGSAGEGTEPLAVTVGALGDERGFFVADTGRGIPPALRDRVFEPGYSTDEHGTGLGLSIVARIVDLHGWTIAVTASASGGARFEIGGVDTA